MSSSSSSQSSEPVKSEPKQPEPVRKSSGKKPIEQFSYTRCNKPRTQCRTFTYSELEGYCNASANCKQYRQAFTDNFGERVGKMASVKLFFENGSFWERTTGVCSAKYQRNKDHRQCIYADINSAGVDLGVGQVNSFYQRKRIAALGGPNCEHRNSRDMADPCNQRIAEWLYVPENNIKVVISIYRENGGFDRWTAARTIGLKNYS